MEVNGWRLYAYEAFLDQLKKLVNQVEVFQEKDPKGFVSKNETKLLGAINKLILEEIPSDPSHSKFKLGKTLGDGNTHWYRAKFYQQYRLFFRYNTRAKIIVFAWVNDTQTKRAYESKNDAYLIFQKMLKRNRPPSDWEDLIKSSSLL
jgi:toxin YhaV